MSAARRWLIPALLALTAFLAVVSVLVGKVTLTWDMWASHDPITRIVFVELRVPRALLAIIIGAALGMSGAAMQSYLRNPLADPGTLGVSAMAALGAVLSIFFGIAGLHPWALPLCGVVGGVLAMAALFLLAGRAASVLTLVLSGVILSSLAVSGISLALSLSPSPWAGSEIIRWLLGALTDRSLDDLTLATPMIVVGAILILLCREAVDALTLGEVGAQSLGINLRRAQWMLCLGTGLMVGASVAASSSSLP